MTWLLFLDESGHDHKNCPYEVRGGIALHAGKLWPFVRQLQQAELVAFGAALHEYRKELKGARLLDKDRFKWAAQGNPLDEAARRKHCRSFLTKGLEKQAPTRTEFTAYGQACIEMARLVFQALRTFEARLFASVIPVTAHKPPTFAAEEYLRKDHVFLLERYYYFLQEQQAHGLLVFDEVEEVSDRRFVRRMERYFSKTQTGRFRSEWIVPVPLFVSSDMSMPVQAADLAIYCVNWGFRLPGAGMDLPVREHIATEFADWLFQLQYRGQGQREGHAFETYGITYVPNPYGDGRC